MEFIGSCLLSRMVLTHTQPSLNSNRVWKQEYLRKVAKCAIPGQRECGGFTWDKPRQVADVCLKVLRNFRAFLLASMSGGYTAKFSEKKVDTIWPILACSQKFMSEKKYMCEFTASSLSLSKALQGRALQAKAQVTSLRPARGTNRVFVTPPAHLWEEMRRKNENIK